MMTLLNNVARPRAVQAFIVVLFSLLVAYLAARGEHTGHHRFFAIGHHWLLLWR